MFSLRPIFSAQRKGGVRSRSHALKKLDGLPQFGKLVDDVIRFRALRLFSSLVRGEENALDADLVGGIDVAEHVIAYEQDIIWSHLKSCQCGFEEPGVRLSVTEITGDDNVVEISIGVKGL